MAFDKAQWQRNEREQFKRRYGYSRSAHYATGGLRERVLKRDEFSCLRCGMTDEDHKTIWSRPITIDHIDRNKKNNKLDNLQTLCLSCHGRKDQLPKLREPHVIRFKTHIIAARAEGRTYQAIADELGFFIGAIWKWCQRWTMQADS